MNEIKRFLVVEKDDFIPETSGAETSMAKTIEEELEDVKKYRKIDEEVDIYEVVFKKIFTGKVK